MADREHRESPSDDRFSVVEWVDSSLQNGQVDRHDFPKPTLITSVGYLLVNDSDHVVLARDDMGDGDYRGLLSIPRECIKKVAP